MLNVPRVFPRLASALAVVSAVAALCAPSLRAQNPGRVEPTFNPGASAVFLPNGTPVFGGTVYSLAVDPVGNVVVAGNFTNAVQPLGASAQRNNLARYSGAGILDTGFNAAQAGGPDAPVFVAVPITATEGMVTTQNTLLGGSFLRVQNLARRRAAAVNDAGVPPAGGGPLANFAPSVNDSVFAVAVQGNAPIIGGRFTNVGGRLVSRIERLSPASGAADTTFNVGAGADGDVLALAVNAADNGIYVGGEFLSFNNFLTSRFVRLTADGAVDFNFNAGTGFNASVRAIQTADATGAALDNNQILVGGDFTSYQGAAANRIVRLNPSGTPDTAFVTATGTGPNGIVRTISVQTDGAIVIGGDFTQFNGVARNGVARLLATGALDPAFNPGGGANATVFAVAVDPGSDAIYVGGAFTRFSAAVRVGFVRLTPAGALDTAFNDASGFGVGFSDQEVAALAATSNGKILVGGNFGSVDGRPRNFVERLNANGTVDNTFQIGRGPDNVVTALLAQPQTSPPDGSDDAIIIAGQFTTVDSGGLMAPVVSGLARLGPTGALDATFQPNVDGQVNAFASTLNGNFYIAGDFRNVSATTRGGIARLTAAGALDPTFDPGTGFSGPVFALGVQNDGRLLAGGRFTAFGGANGATQPFIARILATGAFDRSFVGQPNGPVEAIAVQPDGNILIGGTFTSVVNNPGAANSPSTPASGLARLGVNGRLDPSFVPPVLGVSPLLNPAAAEVLSIAIQPDNRLLIAGNFTSVNGVPRNNLARLNVDGSLDTSFDPGTGANGTVETIVRNANDTVLIGGTFTQVDGQPRARLARLQGNQAPTTIQFSSDTYTVNQVEGTATITVTREGGTAGAVGVTYATSDGTAVSGVNYQTVSGTLFWGDGDGTPKTFTVPVFITPNNGGPTNFTVNLVLSNVTGDANLGTPQTAVLNITSEAPSNVQFAATTFAARETDGSAIITVTRSGGSLATTVTVDYATSDTDGGAGVRYFPTSGTLTFGPNDTTPKTFTIPIINNSVRDGDQLVTLTLGATTGFVVRGTPATASLIIVDDETPPVGANAQFNASTYSVREDAGSVAVVIIRTDAGTSRVAVTYTAAEGSANAAGRFQPTTGTVIFEAGDNSPKVARIPIINNTARDGDATVLLTLTSTAGGAPVPGGTATLTIVDDEALPATLPTTFQFASPVFTALETDGTAVITVTRAGGPAASFSNSGGIVTVQYFVSDLTGRLGVNYANTFASPTSGTLVWSANDFTPKTFTVAILRDNLASGDVQIGVTLASPQSLTDVFGNVTIPASLGNPNQATLRIVDADLPSVLQFTQNVYQTFEDSGAAVVTVVRTGGLGSPVAVAYSTGGGTAGAGQRYTPTSGTLAWAAGDASPKSIVVPILQDDLIEPDQTAGITLGQIQGNAVLGPQQRADILITDDDGGQFFPVITVDSSAAPTATVTGRTKGLFTITRRDRLGNVPNLDEPLTIGYAARGTSMNGQEYRFLSGIVTIPAGQVSARVKVKAINGGGQRMSTVKLVLTNGSGYFINPAASRAKVKIVFPTAVLP